MFYPADTTGLTTGRRTTTRLSFNPVNFVEEWIARSSYTEASEENRRYYATNYLNWAKRRDFHPENWEPTTWTKFKHDNDFIGGNLWNYFSSSRAFIRTMYGDDHVYLEAKQNRPKSPPTEPLTVAEVKRMEASHDLDDPEQLADLALNYLMLDTGLRNSEVCRLLIKDIDFDECQFKVLVKNNRWGWGVFSELTRDAMLWLLESRETYAKPGYDELFLRVIGPRAGEPMDRYHLRDRYYKIGKRAEVDNLYPHRMRATFDTWALLLSGNPELVRIAGRWLDRSMVYHYAPTLSFNDFRNYFPTRKLFDD